MRWVILVVLLFIQPLITAQVFNTLQGVRVDVSVDLKDAEGQPVGAAVIIDTPKGLIIRAEFSRMVIGAHAIHLHQVGKCEAPGFESAGGHFNPAKVQHGYMGQNGPHAGDLPNVYLSAGQAKVDLFVENVRLRIGPLALLDADGASLVVHEGEDDYATDPAGNSGNRIACGVIVSKSNI